MVYIVYIWCEYTVIIQCLVIYIKKIWREIKKEGKGIGFHYFSFYASEQAVFKNILSNASGWNEVLFDFGNKMKLRMTEYTPPILM